MTESIEFQSKSPVKNPYAKPDSPERQAISPAAAEAAAPHTNPMTPPRANPHIKSVTPATAEAKPATAFDAAAEVSPSAAPPSPCATKPDAVSVFASPTPAQQAKIQRNRKRILERHIQSLEKQEPNKKARLQLLSSGTKVCIRCGSTDESTLCITWSHDGEIQRERSQSGWDNFRYDCCGRLSPSCCFIGRHSFSPSGLLPSTDNDSTIRCKCHKGPAKLFCTRKDSVNCGRYFFKCSGDDSNGCNFFLWADKAFGLPHTRCLPARDGIKEWIHVFANPFDQDLNWMEGTASMTPKPVPLLRERLIAALLMHKCCESATSGCWVATATLGGFVSAVGKLFKTQDLDERKALLVKMLSPMTISQIASRFGVTFQEVDELFDLAPTLEECQDALVKASQENAVFRSCGVKVEPIASGMAGYIHLEGLENYLSC